jgi:hypothetical protein
VRAAGASNFLPLEIGWRIPFTIAGWTPPRTRDEAPQAQIHSISEGYLEAMGTAVLAGRTFISRDDRDSPPVVIVNDSFARRYLNDGHAIGRTVRVIAGAIGPLGFNLMARASPILDGVPCEVVGVIGDVRNVPLGQTVEPALYFPTRQFPFSEVYVAVKSADTSAGVAALRRAVAAAAPQVPLDAIRTWSDRFADRTAQPRFLMTMLLLFAALASFLAAVGVYGLFSWSVALRARELSIRLALGARPAGVGAMVVGQSIALVAVGLLMGLAIVRVAGHALASVLYGVTPGDPRSTAAAVGLLVGAALVACLPPALRAMRLDPLEGLRSE